MHSDPKMEELPEIDQLIHPEDLEQAFDESPTKLKEVVDVIKKGRAASAPSPNVVPYKVYKNCQRITKRLWKLIRVIWRRGRLAESWHKAEGCFIPKEEKSETLKQFRTISLLNVEGKIFLATLIIREAKDSKGELTVVWLDLANAHGTEPKKLVESLLEKYHVPDGIRGLIKEYFNHLQLRSVGDFTTSSQRLEVGIVTGCTISVILFSAAMNIIVKSVERKRRGIWMKSGVRQP
ncbi:Hypothetical predicted protein [Mytilus galloprovincialis]|uniref:Reverse transcriptase domain-containing protein n=1 Tax=Mytilus galloprovincialis TaxID=29158 RepID=A0A8B6DLU1_MYTGA|nr:Hypothetical predicted protein [Mytilus galloprovincialis]